MQGRKSKNKTYTMRMTEEFEDAIYAYRARNPECRRMNRSQVMCHMIKKQLAQAGISVEETGDGQERR